ncbi:uncharacterized protein B0H18DRAFT_1210133 [Fomitopsis serialis]|uniref:uncharacterized protein n=1 Tax=Fomitopsis serialis TaxID=139415 RepID=UPI0020079C8C|nr:uncharacterized protein B0H18DRAFT_1210133 [Neoantrodia serialis]KAH9928599.1 hypothetical protein B0H18DRAFT_1210133 [Neoantrodia serialis]
MSVTVAEGEPTISVLADATNAPHTTYETGKLEETDLAVDKQPDVDAPVAVELTEAAAEPEKASEIAEEVRAEVDEDALSAEPVTLMNGEKDEVHENGEADVGEPEIDAKAAVADATASDASHAVKSDVPANGHAPHHDADESESAAREPEVEAVDEITVSIEVEQPTTDAPTESIVPVEVAALEENVSEAQAEEVVESKVEEELPASAAAPSEPTPTDEPSDVLVEEAPTHAVALEPVAVTEAAEQDTPAAESQTILTDETPALEEDGSVVEETIHVSEPSDIEDAPPAAAKVSPEAETSVVDEAPTEEVAATESEIIAEAVSVADAAVPAEETATVPEQEAPAFVEEAIVASEPITEETIPSSEPVAEEPPTPEVPTPAEEPVASEEADVTEAAVEVAAIEEPSASTETAAADEVPAIEDLVPLVEELTASAEPAAEELVAEEPVVAEEPIVVAEPIAAEEPVAAEESVVTEELVVAEEPVATEELVDEELVAVEEPVVAEELVAVEEPVAAEESVSVEEHAVIEEPVSAEEPVVEELATVEESVPVEETVPVAGEAAPAVEVVVDVDVAPTVAEAIEEATAAEPVVDQATPAEDTATDTEDLVEVVEEPSTESVEDPVGEAVVTETVATVVSEVPVAVNEETVAVNEEIVAVEEAAAIEEAVPVEVAAEEVAEAQPESEAVPAAEETTTESIVAVEAPPEEVAGEPFVIEVVTESTPGVEEVIQQEVLPALETDVVPDEPSESIAADATVPSDAPLSDEAVSAEAPVLEESVTSTIVVPIMDEASAVPEAVVDPAAISAEESIPSVVDSQLDVAVAEVVADNVEVSGDNVVEAGNEAPESSTSDEEHVVRSIGEAIAAAAALATVVIGVANESSSDDAVASADETVVPLEHAASEAELVKAVEELPIEGAFTVPAVPETGVESAEAAVEATGIDAVAEEPVIEEVSDVAPAVTVVVEDAVGETAVVADATIDSEITAPASIERPKSPWTPSYSVVRQGSESLSPEEVEGLEQLPPPVAEVQATLEVVDTTIAVPVILTEVVEEPANDLQPTESAIDESSNASGEVPKSPSWLRSYSVSSQGPSPAHSPQVVAVDIEAVQPVEDAEAIAPSAQDEDAANAPESQASTAAEADVTVPAPQAVEIEVTRVESEPDPSEAPVVQIVTTEVVAEPEVEPSASVETTEEAPKSPWVRSYAVSSQGTTPAHKPVATANEDVEEIQPLTAAVAVAAVEAVPAVFPESTPVADVASTEEHKDEPAPAEPVIVLTSEPEQVVPEIAAPIPEPAAAPAVVEIERPKSPWTPSYSVSRQGTTPLSAPVASEEKEVEHIEELPAPLAPIVTVSSESPVEDYATDSGVPAEVVEPPPRPWTPSYSVTSQGPGTPGLKEVEVEPEETTDPPPRPWTPSYTVTTQGPDTTAEAVDVQASETQPAALESDKHAFPTTEGGSKGIATKPSLARLVPLDENEQLQTEQVAHVEVQPPSPTTIRTRHESTTSSRFFPGGWFSSSPKLPEELTSHENAEGEFLKSPSSAVASPGLEVPANTPIDGKIDEEKRGRWCTIM